MRVTYPGLPTPTITSYLSRLSCEESPTRFSPGSKFTLETITMIGNTGTYIVSPFHCFSGGTDLAGLLQTLHSLSDRETVEAVTIDLRWKAACGFGLTETSFHSTVLAYWRRRLAGSARPHRIFEAVAEVSAGSGALPGRKRRSLDSTSLDDAAMTSPSRLTCSSWPSPSAGVESLVNYPSEMTHASVRAPNSRCLTTSSASVGIEDVADLIDDVEQARPLAVAVFRWSVSFLPLLSRRRRTSMVE